MYCNQCGKQIDEKSIFCNYCGSKQIKQEDSNKEFKPVNDETNVQLLFSHKPEFQSSYVVKKFIPAFLFSTFFLSFFITILRGIIRFNTNFNRPSPYRPYDDNFGSSPFVNLPQNIFIGAIISALLIFVLAYNIYKKRYEYSEFKFYSDRMEYIDGYFNYNKKQIYYKNIIEISMSQNVFQREYGIGNIRLTTAGITHHNNHAHSSGIIIFDIPNIENSYQELKKIIK